MPAAHSRFAACVCAQRGGRAEYLVVVPEIREPQAVENHSTSRRSGDGILLPVMFDAAAWGGGGGGGGG
eukprot:COSAG03_NODE_21106_length_309_cov_0.561905_1_plen_68_part_10